MSLGASQPVLSGSRLHDRRMVVPDLPLLRRLKTRASPRDGERRTSRWLKTEASLRPEQHAPWHLDSRRRGLDCLSGFTMLLRCLSPGLELFGWHWKRKTMLSTKIGDAAATTLVRPPARRQFPPARSATPARSYHQHGPRMPPSHRMLGLRKRRDVLWL